MVEFGGVNPDLSAANGPSDIPGRSAEAAQEAHRIGTDLGGWEQRVQSLIDQDATIITFRGAGSVNGIEASSESQAVGLLRDRIQELRSSGNPVVLMFDGDPDNRAKPDIGSVFGQLADTFTRDEGVVVIAAQCEGWYGPPEETTPIQSSTGTPYETYVFSDDLEGQHSSLTQSAMLAAYERYEQVFVGPAGQISFSQLKDLSDKAVAHRSDDLPDVKVTVINTLNNPDLSAGLSAQLDAAEDDTARSKVETKIAQRTEHPYGYLCTAEGDSSLEVNDYPGLAFDVVRISSDGI